MACTKHAWLLTKYLNHQFNSSKVSSQYIENGLTASAGKLDGFMKTWDMVKYHWRHLSSK
jgi:hypothetical protein